MTATHRRRMHRLLRRCREPKSRPPPRSAAHACDKLQFQQRDIYTSAVYRNVDSILQGEDASRKSRFAFDARIDSSVALDDDPLARSAFGGDDPLTGGGGAADPLGGSYADDPLSRGGDGASHDASEEDIPLHDEGTTRIDTFASYGQLLTNDYVRNGSRFGRDSQEDAEPDVFRRQPDEAAADPLKCSPAPSDKGSSRSAPAATSPPIQRADRDAGSRCVFL